MDLGIKGKVAIVTGGSRGLGRVAALALAREGVNVAICGRTQSTLDGTVGELKALGVQAAGIVADMEDESSAKTIYDGTVSELGPVDILVNNVGGRRGSSFVETDEDTFMLGFEVNFFGAMRLMRLAVPGMKARKWGRIVNISSIYGREQGGSVDAALIASTKFAGVELIKDNVLVNSIAPGSIIHPGGSWERFSNEQPAEVVEEFIARNLPVGRFGWPEPVGDLVAYLSSERASMITGTCIPVDAGQGRSLI